MSNWNIDGQRADHDIMRQRISAGTVGDSMMINKGIPGRAVNTVVDDQDARITYGTYNGTGASFAVQRQDGFDSGGTITQFMTKNSAALFTFSGTTIGVLGSSTYESGTIQVYIDGQLTRGRVPEYHSFSYTSYAFANGITATDTTWWVDKAATFITGQYYYIEGEVVKVTAVNVTGTDKFGTGYAGAGNIVVLRAQDGSAAGSHNTNATIYAWVDTINLSQTNAFDYAIRKLLWFNPLLSPGPHKIIVVNTSTTGGYFDFDGFLLGGLIGQDQMAIEYGNVTITGTFNANGYYSGSFSTRTGATIISLLGVTQILPDPTTGVAQAKPYILGQGGTFNFGLVNGPANAGFIACLNFTYISESV